MSDLDILRELIRDDALVSIQKSTYNKQVLVLEEMSEQRNYDLQIHNIPNEIIAFKADKFPPPKAIFNDYKRECKRADFIIIANTPKHNWIIYIEMKAGMTTSASEIVQQLKGAECLIAYCRAIGRAFWLEQGFLNENDYQQRFVSIKNIRLNKQPTRNGHKSGKHDKPENMLKINSPGKKLQFNKLVES